MTVFAHLRNSPRPSRENCTPTHRAFSRTTDLEKGKKPVVIITLTSPTHINVIVSKNFIAVVVDASFAVAKRKPEKFQACSGFQPLTSAIPVQRSTN